MSSYCSSRVGGLKGQLSGIDNYNPWKATLVVFFNLAGAGQWYVCLGSVVLNKAAGSIALVKQVSNCAPSIWRRCRRSGAGTSDLSDGTADHMSHAARELKHFLSISQQSSGLFEHGSMRRDRAHAVCTAARM